jgi:hypothetical protein
MNSTLFWDNRAITFLVLTLAFGTVYALNNLLTAPLLLAPGAHLIHLPSGFKLLLVLVFGMVGALSVFTVSLVAGLGFYFVGELPLSIELAIANAIADALAPLVREAGAQAPVLALPVTPERLFRILQDLQKTQ